MKERLESIISNPGKIVMIGAACAPLYTLGIAFYRGLTDQPLVQGGTEEQIGLAGTALTGGTISYGLATEDMENKSKPVKAAYGTAATVFGAPILAPLLTALFCITGYMFGKIIKN